MKQIALLFFLIFSEKLDPFHRFKRMCYPGDIKTPTNMAEAKLKIDLMENKLKVSNNFWILKFLVVGALFDCFYSFLG